MNKKKLIPPILIIIFSFSAFYRIEGAENVKPLIFITILAMGIGLGVLIKNIVELFNDPKPKE